MVGYLGMEGRTGNPCSMDLARIAVNSCKMGWARMAGNSCKMGWARIAGNPCSMDLVRMEENSYKMAERMGLQARASLASLFGIISGGTY